MTRDLRSLPRAPGRLPLVGHAIPLLRRPLEFLKALADSGDIVRVDIGTMPIYFVTTPQLTHDLLVGKAGAFDKGRFFDRARVLLGNGLATAEAKAHRRNRRLMQPMFHRARIAGYAEAMSARARAVSDSWEEGRTVALDQELYNYSVNALSDTLFSSSIDKETAEAIRHDVPILIKYGLVRAVQPTAVDHLPLRANRQFDAASARLRAIIDDIVAVARDRGDDGPDLLSSLLAARDADTGEALTETEVRDELVTILFAGTETSAATLTWAFHELAGNPEAEQRAVDEVHAVVGQGPVEAHHVPHLKYLAQVVDETARLHALPLLMRRAIEPVELGGVTLPAGTEIGFSLYALHQDRRLYPDPQRFDPDRWAPENSDGRPREAFIPFGAGARKCIGDTFARMEMTIGLATLLARWKLVPVEGVRIREVTAAVAHCDRMPMVPYARNPHAATTDAAAAREAGTHSGT
ncbi:cytochrome P450 [Embleya sp. NBC_00896]|uniref:cytochrome P450 n=1 Tax=Embleya sp. NBC_00896 TaxID=2975961 RepID=UPI002F90C2A3|nr:cytochrome P450 [Embleya sp. NBC_00896]